MLSLRFLKLMLHYLMSLGDISVIYLIRMQKEGAAVNGRSTAYHGVNLIFDLDQSVLAKPSILQHLVN